MFKVKKKSPKISVTELKTRLFSLFHENWSFWTVDMVFTVQCQYLFHHYVFDRSLFVTETSCQNALACYGIFSDLMLLPFVSV